MFSIQVAAGSSWKGDEMAAAAVAAAAMVEAGERLQSV